MKTPKELEDAVRQYQGGNVESFEQIYELSYRYLYTCVIHVVKDGEIAADMLQETYLEISRNLSQLKSAGDFLSWASTRRLFRRRSCRIGRNSDWFRRS